MARPRKVSASFRRVRRAQRRLYHWLREHHDDFAAELAGTPVNDRWSQAMAVITEHQLLDARGNPPSKDTAIETWKRVRADVAAARARPPVPPSVVAPGEIAPGVRATAQAVSATAWANALVGPSTAGHAPMPGSGSAGPRHDSEDNEAMRHLRATMRAGKVKLPKPV